MNDTDEEVLFARLRGGLEALRGRAALGVAADPALAAAVARVEASLRSLAAGLERLAERADATESGLESRIEKAVARATASMRADLDRLALRPSPSVPAATKRPRRVGLGLVVLVIVVLISAAAAVHEGFGADSVGRAMAERFAAWRGLLDTTPPAPPK